MAQIYQPLYNQKPNLGKFITSDSGSYKDVEIYEFGVVKTADPDAEIPDYGYYNSNGDWVSTENEDWDDECKNSYEEIAGEFNYVVSHPASPILAPILWGDENEFIMAKVQVASDLTPKCKLSKALIAVKTKRVYMKVLKLCSYAKINTSLNTIDVRFSSFNDIIKFGFEQGLSEESIAKTIYHFLRLDACGGIMSDMHNSNFGLYKNRIVTFDLGLAGHNNSNSLKKFLKERQQAQVKRIKTEIQEGLEFDAPFYKEALQYKRERKLLNFEYKNVKYFNVHITKVAPEYLDYYYITFDNGLTLRSHNLKNLVIF